MLLFYQRGRTGAGIPSQEVRPSQGRRLDPSRSSEGNSLCPGHSRGCVRSGFDRAAGSCRGSGQSTPIFDNRDWFWSRQPTALLRFLGCRILPGVTRWLGTSFSLDLKRRCDRRETGAFVRQSYVLRYAHHRRWAGNRRIAARFAAAKLRGEQFPPPPRETAIGTLLAHITGSAMAEAFQPINVNYRLIPPMEVRVSKTDCRKAHIDRARTVFSLWLDERNQEDRTPKTSDRRALLISRLV